MDALIGKSLADSQKPWIVTCRCGRTPSAFLSCDARGKTTDAQGRTFGNGGEWDGVHLLCPCGVVLRMEDWVVTAVLRPLSVSRPLVGTSLQLDPTCECGRTSAEFSACDEHGALQPGDDWEGEHLRCPCGVVVRTADWCVVAILEPESPAPAPSSPPATAAEAVERLSKLGVAVVVMVRDYLVDGHTVSEQELLAMAAGIHTTDELSMYFNRGR